MTSWYASARLFAAASAALWCLCASAQTEVSDPWIRGTVAQQKATGAFMKITSTAGARLISAASPVAGVVEIHEMAMDGQVMRMRALKEGLELPSGRTIELKPGSYHVMLMDLKRPLSEGEQVPMTLTVQTRDGKSEVLQLQVPVKAISTPTKGHRHH